MEDFGTEGFCDRNGVVSGSGVNEDEFVSPDYTLERATQVCRFVMSQDGDGELHWLSWNALAAKNS